MRSKIIALPLWAMLLFNLPARALPLTGEKWRAFVNRPSHKTYDDLVNDLGVSCTDEECLIERAPRGAVLTHLLVLIDKRNSLAIDLGFRSLNFTLPGGYLEETLEHLGELADDRPREFLQNVARLKLGIQEIDQIVTFLPNKKTTDNYPETIRIIKTRIASLSSVKNKHLLAVREAAVAALKEELTSIEIDTPEEFKRLPSR